MKGFVHAKRPDQGLGAINGGNSKGVLPLWRSALDRFHFLDGLLRSKYERIESLQPGLAASKMRFDIGNKTDRRLV